MPPTRASREGAAADLISIVTLGHIGALPWKGATFEDIHDESEMVKLRKEAQRVFFTGTILAFVATAQAAAAYQESPMLAERVAKGELPPVAERLPENPMVIEPVNEIGKYGGIWRRLCVGAGDLMLNTRMGYEPLVRWDRTGKEIVPNIATHWEVLDGGKTYVFHLRKGMRWSDGHPFTSADYTFYFDDILASPELTPVFPRWLSVGGEPAQLVAPDEHTIVFRFAQPHGIFLEMLGYMGIFLPPPKHYLKQYLPKYTDEEELNRMAAERGYSHWRQIYYHKCNENENPEVPTLRPFTLTQEPPRSRLIAERNPFYWKVDPEGNQLPYIDQVAYRDVQNNEVLTMKAQAGEVDFQARRVDASNYTLFMENREAGNYRVLRDINPGAIVLYLNQHSKDPVMRGILKDRRFRIALSVAIDREELIFLLYGGMAAPARGVASRFDPYYLPEYDENYLEYDPDRANALLDEAGLLRDGDGLRRLPDGRPFRQLLNVFPSETGTSMDLWQLVSDYFREVGLEFVVKTDARTLSSMQVMNGNSDFWAYSTSGLHWIVDPCWYVPWQSSSYFAPLYGRYVNSDGKDQNGIKPPPEYQRLVDWYMELFRTSGNEERKLELGRKILGQHAEECYTIGICQTELLTIVGNSFKNVPDHVIHDWRIMTPGYIGIEQFYMDEDE